MSETLNEALKAPGPHTAASLAARLPAFPEAVIAQALDALAAQGVLEREAGTDGVAQYRYVAPDRYQQINLDVVRDPGTGIRHRSGKPG